MNVCGDEETARVVLALIPDEGLDFLACMATETMAGQIKMGLAPSIRRQWVSETKTECQEQPRSRQTMWECLVVMLCSNGISRPGIYRPKSKCFESPSLHINHLALMRWATSAGCVVA